MIHHPDKALNQESKQRGIKIIEAYKQLMDATQKQEIDNHLKKVKAKAKVYEDQVFQVSKPAENNPDL